MTPHKRTERLLREPIPPPAVAEASRMEPDSFHTAREGTVTTQRCPWKRIDIGGVAVSSEALILRTLLGSCVTVCLYDPTARAGGMNHILVPSSMSDGNCAARCGVQAMELLINALMKLGVDRRRLVAKAFGGANVLPSLRGPAIGESNAKFVRTFLDTERIPLLAERMGGEKPVLVNFYTDTGKAIVRTVDGSHLPTIVRDEISYYNMRAENRFRCEEPTIY